LGSAFNVPDSGGYLGAEVCLTDKPCLALVPRGSGGESAFANSQPRALEEEGGVTFRLLSGAQIRPKGVLRVSRRMLTSTVQGFEEWQILEGTEWIPFEVNRQWLRFLTPQNQILDENTHIGYFQLEVSVLVSCEEVESWEEMATNVDLDDISTPRSRSSASSTR
jgi:hypothetical protein